jgi:hypothetical protein
VPGSLPTQTVSVLETPPPQLIKQPESNAAVATERKIFFVFILFSPINKFLSTM